jgi:hypothetical protein
MNKAPQSKDMFRLMASLELEGEPIGPFRFEGTRKDDPNDTVNHENRRDLRALHVFAAWLNHTDAPAMNTLDTVVEENGTAYVRHHLLDFSSAFGADSTWAKDARHGNRYDLPRPVEALGRIVSLGLFPSEWEQVKYPDIPAAGRFESAHFDPDTWKPIYPNPAFLRRLPDDEFWAGKTVMAFSDEDIRAIVETGEFTNGAVVDYITKTLAVRRDRIGRKYFSKVIPLDNFRVQNGELQFDDLAVKYGLEPSRKYTSRWFYLNNASSTRTPLPGSVDLKLPAEIVNADSVSYFSVVIRPLDSMSKTVAVDLRKTQKGIEVVGIERTW